jgi:hypothetical protein
VAGDTEVKESREALRLAKWESLKARGITPPDTKEEQEKRLRDAHGY